MHSNMFREKHSIQSKNTLQQLSAWWWMADGLGPGTPAVTESTMNFSVDQMIQDSNVTLGLNWLVMQQNTCSNPKQIIKSTTDD